jgi:hypothetical protein
VLAPRDIFDAEKNEVFWVTFDKVGSDRDFGVVPLLERDDSAASNE